MRVYLNSVLVLFVLAVIAGCGSRGRGSNSDGTCDLTTPQCPDGLVCNALLEGEARCVAPLIIRGTVQDATDDLPIAQALVQAVDVNGAAVGTSAATDDAGGSRCATA